MSTLTHAEYAARRHIPALDGIRAISILLVVTHHPVYPGGWPIFHGATGVSIFFVLSGFLITMLLLREEQRSGRISLSAFYTRRLFRIAPLFLLTFLLYVVLIFGLGMQADRRQSFVENIPYYLLFMPERAMFFNTWPQSVPFDGTWSLGIEEKFYFVWPVLGFVLLKARTRARLATLGLVVAASVVSNAVGGGWGMALAPYGLLAIGSALAILLHHESSYRVVSLVGRPRVLLPLALAFVALQFSTSAITIGNPLYLAYGVAVAAVLGGLVVTTARWTRFLQTAPMVLLGRLSYGLYLFHNFGLNLAETVIPQTSFLASLLATTVGLGASVFGMWVLHRVVEQPCIALGHRVSARIKRDLPNRRPVGPRRALITGEVGGGAAAASAPVAMTARRAVLPTPLVLSAVSADQPAASEITPMPAQVAAS